MNIGVYLLNTSVPIKIQLILLFKNCFNLVAYISYSVCVLQLCSISLARKIFQRALQKWTLMTLIVKAHPLDMSKLEIRI